MLGVWVLECGAIMDIESKAEGGRKCPREIVFEGVLANHYL